MAVIDDSSEPAPAEEEVAFWRGFIEWWARERREPVPPRAWEALARAEQEHAGAAAAGGGSTRPLF
jgi:hypothetical protein